MEHISKTIEPINRPSFIEWMRELKVSSRYINPTNTPNTQSIDLIKLKKSINKMNNIQQQLSCSRIHGSCLAQKKKNGKS